MTKRKIPRLALAALTLGACAGGDGDGEGNPAALDALSGGSQDVSQERVDAVAAAMCDQFNECDATRFREEYTSVQECAASVAQLLDEESRSDAACKDALLDLFTCSTKLSCGAGLDYEETGCETLDERAEEKCSLNDDDDYDDYDYDDYDYDDYDY